MARDSRTQRPYSDKILSSIAKLQVSKIKNVDIAVLATFQDIHANIEGKNYTVNINWLELIMERLLHLFR